MNLITQILNYFRNLFTSSAYRVAKYNEKEPGFAGIDCQLPGENLQGD